MSNTLTKTAIRNQCYNPLALNNDETYQYDNLTLNENSSENSYLEFILHYFNTIKNDLIHNPSDDSIDERVFNYLKFILYKRSTKTLKTTLPFHSLKLSKHISSILFYLYFIHKKYTHVNKFNFNLRSYNQFVKWCREFYPERDNFIIDFLNHEEFENIKNNKILNEEIIALITQEPRKTWRNALDQINTKNKINLELNLFDRCFWSRENQNQFIQITPSIAREESLKNSITINNESLINEYETHSYINELDIHTTKFRCGSIYSENSAFQYILKMIYLNQHAEDIIITDSRYINSFENFDQDLINDHNKYIKKVLNKITINGKIDFNSLRNYINQYKKLNGFNKYNDKDLPVYMKKFNDMINEKFINQVRYRGLVYIPLNICSYSVYGMSLGFNDKNNKNNFQKFYDLLNQLPIINLTDNKIKFKKLWMKELQEVITSVKPNCLWTIPRILVKFICISGVLICGVVGFCLLTISIPFHVICKSKNYYFHNLKSSVQCLIKGIYDWHSYEYLAGDRAYLVDSLITNLAELHGIKTSGGCKSNKDRSSMSQIVEACVIAVWNYRLKNTENLTLTDFSFLKFNLENEIEKKLVRDILNEQIPETVTYLNNHKKGAKSLEGIQFLLDQAYSNKKDRKELKKLLIGEQLTLSRFLAAV